ncbi:molybdopterin-dependent oxidoreductase [Modestobacter roseus]|uniref:DMSO/TMAO reductase YedYZ molybdopterin-dependent catalytic subunit n=1 Tax=Modestobacter roseus TaxID=1181884 RepID=A0A562ILZ2_9ACTN|nr:molybdopterin-dependent oxidoreductase [Modestobacter roseus]MQA32218.1 molybdopterin-dependent oxidoreductase [Modestobacter roseus]TWH71713.1 DMSO/TMAO reductase YedYZ molybdopterin-dependent catalytic subunit [Modestobacter roseus]
MTAALDRLLGARLPDPPEGLRRGPFRRGAFPSPLHSERRTARVGVWLGAAFLVCFGTGLISHWIQQPPGWFTWPAEPVWLYRVTQGTHVAVGLAAIPLILVKLWTVYPELFRWPPVSTVAGVVSRLSILVLVGAGVMQLATGLINISQWYPFGFFFTVAHYWTGWIAIGAVAVHVGAYAPQIRRGLARRGSPAATAGLAAAQADEVAATDAAAEDGAVSRRTFVLATGLGVGAVALTTWGQTISALSPVSGLAPRAPGVGPQGVPVNQTAAGAGVTETAVDPAFRLVVEGPERLELSLADLAGFDQHTERLPITCVEGWSADGDWTGPRLRDVLAAAGIPADTSVTVESLQTGGLYRVSTVRPPHATSPRTLLALQLSGEPLDLDHGYPVRLIAPNRPGVMQTKWITRIAPGTGGIGA